MNKMTLEQTNEQPGRLPFGVVVFFVDFQGSDARQILANDGFTGYIRN